MKKLILSILALTLSSGLFAADFAKVKIRITNPVHENKYFLCLYNVGCMSINAGNRGRQFPMMAQDIGNIEKFVVTDVTDMSMHMTTSNNSCNVQVSGGQTLTISGQLEMVNSQPIIKNLHCSVG